MVLGGLWHVLLLATASSTELPNVNGRAAALQHGAAEAKGHTATPSLRWQHVAPPQPTAGPRDAPPDASEATASSPASLPLEMLVSAKRGEVQEVVEWLRMGGAINALGSVPMNGGQTTTTDGRTAAASLLHVAAGNGHLELVRELLKRGASVDLPSSLGATALMSAAAYGHLSILLLLLQHSANPDLQDDHGSTALMQAAGNGHEACVQALLRAGANTELLENYGRTALQWAATQGHTATAKLLRDHTAPLQPAAAVPAARRTLAEPRRAHPPRCPSRS